LAKEKSPDALYDAIVKACHSLSLSMRERISNYIAENFSWEATFEKLINLYAGTLAVVTS